MGRPRPSLHWSQSIDSWCVEKAEASLQQIQQGEEYLETLITYKFLAFQRSLTLAWKVLHQRAFSCARPRPQGGSGADDLLP